MFGDQSGEVTAARIIFSKLVACCFGSCSNFDVPAIIGPGIVFGKLVGFVLGWYGIIVGVADALQVFPFIYDD